jgi:hypothetical protein
VIKVERPGSGDFARGYDERVAGLASHFVWTNRSKESLTLDLKQPQALEVLMQLVGRADVLVQNLAPGAAAPPRPLVRGAARGASRARRLRHLRLRRRSGAARAVSRQEGLRPADPERVGLPLGDRLGRRSRPRPAARSPTSPPACTRTRASSRR